MSCPFFVERYTDWREGRLSGWRSLVMRAHLAWCPGCPIFASQIDETVSALRALGESPPDVDPPATLLDALRRGRER